MLLDIYIYLETTEFKVRLHLFGTERVVTFVRARDPRVRNPWVEAHPRIFPADINAITFSTRRVLLL